MQTCKQHRHIFKHVCGHVCGRVLVASFCRDNSINVINPAFIDTLPERLYDEIHEKQGEAKNNILSSDFSRSANKDADCDTIKSSEVQFDGATVYYNANASEENTAYYAKPKTPARPKDAKTPVAIPVSQHDHHVPTNESPSPQDEYLLPDIPYTIENQHTSQEETERAENNHYTPLLVSQQKQPAAYQELVGKRSPPST